MSDSQTRQIIENHGGTIRMSEALNAGINRYTLYSMLEEGKLERLSRGLYQLTEKTMISDPDLVIIAKRIPKAVICLVSALSFHELTTQVPHKISIAVPAGINTPRLDYPPIHIHRFSEQSYQAGIENHQLDGIIIHVYSSEKTLVDCFKFRNKIGMDVVLEALKLYREKQSMNIQELMEYARVCRVSSIITPYLEASL